jgi:DNA-binding YbaB/EbfC family protein
MGMNPQKMLQQVQLMQQQMQKAQEELETATVEGSAGGGAVKVTVTGKQVLTSLEIDPSAVDPDDVEMLQDLVMTAVNEALKASQQLAEQKMGAVTAGVRIPGLF